MYTDEELAEMREQYEAEVYAWFVENVLIPQAALDAIADSQAA